MPAFLIRRALGAAAMLCAVATIVFSILQIVPGDPAELLLSSGGRTVTPEAVANLRTQMGLDRPVTEQYANFMKDLAGLDFGSSIIDGSSISGNIGARLPRTLELIAAAAIIALGVAIPAGTFAALNAGGTFDRIASGVSALFMSVPVFVVGTIFIYLFAQTLNILPAGGYVPLAQSPGQHLTALFLPALSVSLGLMAIVYRMVRGSVMETRSNDWVRTAKAKGLPWRKVVRSHILRNSLGPVITVIGIQLGVLLGSTVLVEYVYNWPGLSGFLVTAVEQRDYPVVRAVIMTVSAIFILINLVVEIIYSLLDPRIQLK
ncbi:ABC transporter permease [Rhizobium miluonense]|uniref:Peptide/nickel transport system permease protein n=1 Tax=Rhizobium miluonense TaxID=411945 RepID=A0A1C3WD13_9HYPH|nr:ABC transporter permease [Rhizobium miluonense]SCB37853.1 peptide/nickel transport system permease protein [Rhizobium miluonense]